jgi:hypothetical protein
MICVLAVLASLFVLGAAVEAIGRITRADAYARTAMTVAASVLFYTLLAMAICTWWTRAPSDCQPLPAQVHFQLCRPPGRAGCFIATHLACINGCVKIASTQPWRYGGECRVGSAHWSLFGRFSFPVCSLTPPAEATGNTSVGLGPFVAGQQVERAVSFLQKNRPVKRDASLSRLVERRLSDSRNIIRGHSLPDASSCILLLLAQNRWTNAQHRGCGLFDEQPQTSELDLRTDDHFGSIRHQFC